MVKVTLPTNMLNKSSMLTRFNSIKECIIEIKFNDKPNILVFDVLHIVYQLGLTQRVGTTLVDIISDDIHHKTSMIRFKLF